MADETVRVYRILIYEGPRRWVEGSCLDRRQVKGTWYPDKNHHPDMRIIEALVGEFPSVIGDQDG